MKRSSSDSILKMSRSLLHSLRKLGNLARVSLHGLLLLWSWLRSFIRQRWPPSEPSKIPPDTPINRPVCQSEDRLLGGDILHNDSIPISCSVYLPSSHLRVGSVPQNLDVLQPLENVDYLHRSRSHLSLPNPITPYHSSQIFVSTESDSPVPVEPERSVLSIPGNTELSHPKIRPFVPELLQRYDRNVKLPKKIFEYTIPPLTTSFDMPFTPLGWTPCFHPEGALYFFHEEKRIFTDTNLYEMESLTQIQSDIAVIEEFFRVNNVQRSRSIDLVLDLQKTDDGIHTLYYLIDHSARCVFFLDSFDAAGFPTWHEVKGVRSPTHVKHQVETNYWYHCLMFPRSLELSENLILEFRDLVIHSMSDQMVSQTSVVPFNVDDLQKLLLLANSLQHNTGSRCSGSVCFLSVFMYITVGQRFYNFHGQPGARMGRDQSVYGDKQSQRSWLTRALSPVLFFAPEVHLQSLEEIWVDGIARRNLWKAHIAKLNSEWQEFTLYATVILNANVAFLAIQSVDSSSPGNSRSPAQIASYSSIATSIGSIILGLLLVRQNRNKDSRDAADISRFLHRRRNQALGLESLALMFSLPYGLLMWGMICFLVAFLFVCFDGSDVYTRSLVGATCGSITFLIMCGIWMAWEGIPGMPMLNRNSGVEEEEQEKGTGEEKTDGSKGTESEKGGSQTPKFPWKWQTIFRRDTSDSEATIV